MSGTRTPSPLTLGFSLRQASIEGGVSVRFQSLVKMELALTDAMWHSHAGIDKWIGLVWTESKIDQNKIASDVESKMNQRRRPGESVESWHKDTLHFLLRVSTPCLRRMSTVSWLIPLSHLVVVPLQVALRHSLLPSEVRPDLFYIQCPRECP
jgi:hypothetical protein